MQTIGITGNIGCGKSTILCMLASLGARVLCKRVASLGMHRTHGARHLWAQAESDSWRAFLGALLQHERRTDRTALIAGANAAFLNAAACMERAAHG